MYFMGNGFQTVYYFCKELRLRYYRVPRISFSSFSQQLWTVPFHLIKFSLILLAYKSEHMEKIDNVISMDFAKFIIKS